jgi:uncharacterized protein YbjT (DUF2867 family)
MTASAPILVTGATGRHGSTGAHVAKRLREEGWPVRVLARTPSSRTDELAALGAEVVVGDLHDRRSLMPALTGVERAYFTYPVGAGIVSAAANYAAAARVAGQPVRTVVMSMAPAHPEHPCDLGRAQWLAEEVMTWAGLDLQVLRVAATFHENISALHGESIRRDNVLRNSFGDKAVGWISGADAGELAVSALLHPERFDERVCYPSGSELFDHFQVAELLSEELGRIIKFEPVSRDEWRRDLIDLSDLTATVWSILQWLRTSRTWAMSWQCAALPPSTAQRWPESSTGSQLRCATSCEPTGPALPPADIHLADCIVVT